MAISDMAVSGCASFMNAMRSSARSDEHNMRDMDAGLSAYLLVWCQGVDVARRQGV